MHNNGINEKFKQICHVQIKTETVAKMFPFHIWIKCTNENGDPLAAHKEINKLNIIIVHPIVVQHHHINHQPSTAMATTTRANNNRRMARETVSHSLYHNQFAYMSHQTPTTIDPTDQTLSLCIVVLYRCKRIREKPVAVDVARIISKTQQNAEKARPSVRKKNVYIFSLVQAWWASHEQYNTKQRV